MRQRKKRSELKVKSENNSNNYLPDRLTCFLDEASSIWSKPIELKEEKSKEEEYEDYFADLLQ